MHKDLVRTLAVIEAYSVTGPAKNLIEFSRQVSRGTSRMSGAEVILVTFQRGRLDPPNAFVTAAREAGLVVHVIAEHCRFDVGVISQLRRVIAQYQPDILQTHTLKAHFLVRLGKLNREIPWIAFHHGYTTPDLRMRLYNQLNRWSLPAATRIVAVCRQFSEEVQRCGIPAERILVQHNMVKPFVPSLLQDIEAVHKAWHLPPGTKILLAVGRLSREKGHLDLIQAIACLRQRRPSLSFHLMLVGEGPDRGAIERKLAKLDLEDWVTLTGHQTDLRPYYSMADILLIPSHSEGSPNVLLEAMAAGVPVVATSVGGIPEIAVNEENALLIQKGDAPAMAEAAIRLLEDPSLSRRLANSAREIGRHYTPEAYCRSLLQLYHQVLDSNPLYKCESR